MTDDEVQEATVAVGRWHYDDGHYKPVRIVGLTYDYWYAVGEADGQLEADEQPQPLGDKGRLYYPYFAQLQGPGFPTVIQAKGYAQSMVQSPILWD
jgi:hypothetical protein